METRFIGIVNGVIVATLETGSGKMLEDALEINQIRGHVGVAPRFVSDELVLAAGRIERKCRKSPGVGEEGETYQLVKFLDEVIEAGELKGVEDSIIVAMRI